MINGTGQDGWGIVVDGKGGAIMDVAVAFNEVRGQFDRGAIGTSEGLFSIGDGAVESKVYSNVIVCGGQLGRGITQSPTDGTIDVEIVNNTVVDCSTAVSFSRWFGSSGAGGTTGNVLNNLVAFNSRGMFYNSEFMSTVPNSFNLVHGNGSNQYTPGSNTITSHPRILKLSHPWLQQDSPARNTGNAFAPLLQSLAGLAQLDAAGLRRLKETTVDIGAYEYGDIALMHTADSGTISGHTSAMAGNPYDTDSNAKLLVTSNYNGMPGGNGPLFDDPIGVYRTLGQWYVFSQNFADILNGTKFNVFYPASGNGVFTHISNTGNISGWSTAIDDASLNDKPERFVLVTQNWTAGGMSVYNAHPIGVFYFAFGGPGSWFITNIDQALGEDMAANLGFNVYSQEMSPNAFRLTANIGNVVGQGIRIDHPLTNGNRCAQIQATRISQGGPVTEHFDLRYIASAGQWTILHQNVAAVPMGSEYFVLVNARQVHECSSPLFEDGFES